MILTCHLLTGAAITSRISNPFLALPLAFLSHFLLDLLPHKDYQIINILGRRWDKTYGDFAKVFLDISLGTILILLFSKGDPVIFGGAFFAVVPDGITLLGKILPRNKLAILHQALHTSVNNIGDFDKNKKIPVFWGISNEILVVLTSIFLLR